MDCSEDCELTKADLEARKFTVANRKARGCQHTIWQTEATNTENLEL